MVQWLRMFVLTVAVATGCTSANAPPQKPAQEPVREPVKVSTDSVKLRVRRSPDDGTTIYDLAKLQPYFTDRHRHAEKLTLQALEVNAGSWHHG